MTNAQRWYTSIEKVKAAVGITGPLIDPLLGTYIEASSEGIERMLASRGNPLFIPETKTRLYPWPQIAGRSAVLDLKADLLSVTTLQSEAQDSSPTTIAAADYFLEPVNNLPYRRIEIDRSSTSAFAAGDTGQRSISVAGSWGYSNATKAAGAIGSEFAASTTLTVCLCSNAALIDVGDTLLCESEQMFVSGRAFVDQGTNLNDTLTAVKTDTTVTYSATPVPVAGESVLIDSEEMLIVSINGNDLNMLRATNGTTLAAHSNGAGIQFNRTLTVVRGVNGTTAANHADTTAFTKYAPPADVATLCLGEAILLLKQGKSGWAGQIGGDQGRIDVDARGTNELREDILARYGLVTL